MKKILNAHIAIQVKHENAEAFIAACADNARESRKEPGVIRFDLLQDCESHNNFLLVEVYRDSDAAAAHKASAHYARWRDAVEPMMAQPRVSTKFYSIDSPDLAL